jgi:hypothetical protein
MPSFDPTSRYARTPVETYLDDDGREIRYVGRRFLPEGSRQPLLAEVDVAQRDRPDLVAQRTLADPLAWWRVADANDAMDPAELTEEPGARLRVAVPQAEVE